MSFGGGLDQKTDPKQITADDFLALNNMVFTVGGRLTKRNGFAGGYTKTVITPNPALTYSVVPGTITAATKVFSYNNELLLNDSWNLYSWDASALAWNYKGRDTQVSLITQSVIANGALTFHSCDMSIDTASGIKVFAASEDTGNSGGRSYYSIQDTTTGQFIVNQASFGAYSYVRCVSVSGKSWVFGVNGSNGHIDYQAIVGQTVTGSPTSLVTDLNATHQFYDIDVDPNTGNIYIAYYSSTPNIKIAAVSTSMVIGNTIIKSETASNGLSWFGDGTNIWVVYNNATATKAFIVNNAVTTTTLAPTVVDGSAANCNNVTGCWSSTQSKAFIFYDAVTIAGGAITAAKITYNTLTVAGTAGTAVLFVGSLSVNSKAWVINGIPHLMGLFSISISSAQATNFLLNLYNVTPSMGGSTNNDVIANIAGKVSPDEAAQVCWAGGSFGGSGSLPGAKQNASGYWELAALQNNDYGTSSVFYIAPTAVIDVQFNFSPANPDVQSLGNNAAIAGSSVLNYDGATISEQNFHLYPYNGGNSIATGGGGTHLGLSGSASTYSYIYTYEWIDNQGQVHRSFPSAVITPLSGSTTFASGVTDGVITLTIPTLRVTNKPGTQVVINIYRTVANGSVYFQLSAFFGTVINDPSVATVTYVDGEPDSLIIENIQLYTTGALGYFAPPASSALTNFKNRAIYVSSEDQYQIGYSNAVLQNFPVQFVPEFIINIGTVGGTLTTVAQMDDKMILFKSGKISGPAIYYMQGQGPAPSGAGNDFQDPLPITVDAGCVDRPSVVLTPVGLMFKSDKGIYLIDRSLQASYIGAQVEGYNQYSVLSAQLIPNTTQVRFWLSNGTLLMYDYFYKKWASWTPPAGISDCIFQGQHTYVTAAGQVYQETPGLYVDGTNVPVLWSFTTAWVQLMGLQGYQRAFWFLLIGDYISAHKLAISLFTDFSTTPDSSVTITPNSQKALEDWRVFFAKQRCQSFQVQMSEVYTGTLGQGLNLSGLNLVVGAKSKHRTISAAQSTG